WDVTLGTPLTSAASKEEIGMPESRVGQFRDARGLEAAQQQPALNLQPIAYRDRMCRATTFVHDERHRAHTPLDGVDGTVKLQEPRIRRRLTTHDRPPDRDQVRGSGLGLQCAAWHHEPRDDKERQPCRHQWQPRALPDISEQILGARTDRPQMNQKRHHRGLGPSGYLPLRVSITERSWGKTTP